MKRMFPDDEEVQAEHEGEEGTRLFVRITDLPLQDKLRELRWGRRLERGGTVSYDGLMTNMTESG